MSVECAPYWSINREERFYCFLLGHALLMSLDFRREFCRLVHGSGGKLLDPDNLQVFVEAAVLRDHWNRSCGHAQQDGILSQLLPAFGIMRDRLADNSFLYTDRHRMKYCSPARWRWSSANAAMGKELDRIRSAFNAKPDMVVSSPGAVLVIEAKVDSPMVRHNGRTQLEVQADVITCWRLLLDEFRSAKMVQATLTRKRRLGNGGGVIALTWDDMVGIMSRSQIDDFTIRCMVNQFGRVGGTVGGRRSSRVL